MTQYTSIRQFQRQAWALIKDLWASDEIILISRHNPIAVVTKIKEKKWKKNIDIMKFAWIYKGTDRNYLKTLDNEWSQ